MADIQACMLCQQRDDHPKHQIAVSRDISIYHHHDCGALASPACGVCVVLAGEAPKKNGPPGAGKVPVTGEEMRKHLIGLPPRAWTHHPDGSVTYEDNPEPVTGGEG